MRVRLVVAALCSFPAFFLPAPVGAMELAGRYSRE